MPTTYSRTFARGRAGQLSNSNHLTQSFTNGSGAALTPGVLVAQKASTEGSADVFDSALDTVLGVAVFSYAVDPNDVSNDASIASTATFDVLTEGEIFVLPEQTVAVGDPVYARITSDGASNTVLGKFRKDGDSGKAVLLKGARWVKSGSTSSVAVLYFSATAQKAGDNVEVVVPHISVSADATTKEYKTRSDRFFVVDKVQYVNATGLAADASNTFNIKLLGGSTVLANWDTTTGQQGAITADTFIDMVLNSTAANLCLAPDTVVSLFLDKTGTQTLPAGKVVIHGHYV